MILAAEKRLCDELKLPVPPGVAKPADIEWDHPYLVFMAEHGKIARNEAAEKWGTSQLHRIAELDFLIKCGFTYEDAVELYDSNLPRMQ